MASEKIYKVSLEQEKETLLMTLQAKALDSRSKNPILNDQKAAEILHLIDYDFEKVNNFGNELMVVRAKQLDTWLQEFLAVYSDATILNLGCGLDTRVSRINPTANVSWFDVDYHDVIELRKHFFSKRGGYEMISTSVTELSWLKSIPSNKPVMIIAEGLLEYLTEIEVQTLLNRLTGHFTHGRIAFDVMNSFAINSGKDRLKEKTGAVHNWMVDDIQQVDQLNSKLIRTANLSVMQSKYIQKLPLKIRLTYTAMSFLPAFRNMLRLLSYKF